MAPCQVQNYDEIDIAQDCRLCILYKNTESHVTWRRKSVRTRAPPRPHLPPPPPTHRVLLSTQVLHVSCNNVQTSCKESTHTRTHTHTHTHARARARTRPDISVTSLQQRQKTGSRPTHPSANSTRRPCKSELGACVCVCVGGGGGGGAPRWTRQCYILKRRSVRYCTKTGQAGQDTSS